MRISFRPLRLSVILSFLFAAMISLAQASDQASTMTHDGIMVMDGWARASATKQAKAGAAYFMVHNHGKHADTLVGAESAVAKTVEIHTHTQENGVMRMGPAGDVDIPVDGMLTFKPGGLHVMLIGLHKPLIEGEGFEITLQFEKAGAKTIPVTIKSVAAKSGGEDHSGHDHSGHDHSGHDHSSHKHSSHKHSD